jgi:hypothetical protein
MPNKDIGVENSFARHLENPFLVLGLAPAASIAEVERTGQRLLGLLVAGLAEGATYTTPLGVATRTAEQVRWAMAELREPCRRLGHEWWARGWQGSEGKL